MAVKSDRIEARVSPDQRTQLERGARLAGTSISAFVVDAAVARAEELISEHLVTTVPGDYFDRLASALDLADHAPKLRQAARRSKQRPRIATR